MPDEFDLINQALMESGADVLAQTIPGNTENVAIELPVQGSDTPPASDSSLTDTPPGEAKKDEVPAGDAPPAPVKSFGEQLSEMTGGRFKDDKELREFLDKPQFEPADEQVKLINELKGVAKKSGAYVIFVQADKEDAPAIKLYESLGTKEDTYNFDIPI